MDAVRKQVGHIDGGDQGAIMASLDPEIDPGRSSTRTPSTSVGSNGLPDVLSTELKSLNLHADGGKLSFLLLDSKDRLSVSSDHDFALMLGCDPNSSLNAKVISIIGNTGEGKSYSLNRGLFSNYDGVDSTSDDPEVFSTSSSAENSCTRGVWAAFEPRFQLVALDTEGMLGNAANGSYEDEKVNENLRTRQLLKVLAVSDIVVYKTRAERLHSDLFYFLGDASKAYQEHFNTELQRVAEKSTTRQSGHSVMGPTVIIFHETRFTDVLAPTDDEFGTSKSPETIIRDRLVTLNQDVSAFSKILYFGVKRQNGDRDEIQTFSKFRKIIEKEAKNTSVRSPRSLSLIYRTLQSLNTKFSGDISPTSHRSFPDEYFTCQSKCTACDSRCNRAMNHEGEHTTRNVCIYQKSLDNKHYFCLRCYQNGRRIVVVPKASSSEDGSWLGLATYAWSGSVLECKICGVIYRSRQHWYGNEMPESLQVVQTEVSHLWPGVRTLQGTENAARMLLDGVQVLSSTVSTFSSAVAPAKTLSGWMADKIAPDYWRPNSEILNCNLCGVRFGKQNPDLSIHHCRACGEGFCDDCSSYRRPVPERGWDPQEQVRVCRGCMSGSADGTNNPEAVQARKYGEKVVGTLSSIASTVLEYPIGALKDSARPAYWVPDEEIEKCCVCDIKFETSVSLSSSTTQPEMNGSAKTSVNTNPNKVHHCRKCGRGVCGDCSKSRQSVPARGWDQPVRICDECRQR